MRQGVAFWGFIAALVACTPARAFTVNVSSSDRIVYLRVGTGTLERTWWGSYVIGNDPTVDRVSVTLPAEALLTSATHPMRATPQPRDCAAPGIVVSAIFTSPGNRIVTLSADSNDALDNRAGARIPLSRISWTSSDTNVIAAGRFNDGVQTLGTYPNNTYNETCLSFSFNQPGALPAGSYEGTVTYTLAQP